LPCFTHGPQSKRLRARFESTGPGHYGIFIKGLVWLLVIGIVLFAATSLSAFVKHKTSS